MSLQHFGDHTCESKVLVNIAIFLKLENKFLVMRLIVDCNFKSTIIVSPGYKALWETLGLSSVLSASQYFIKEDIQSKTAVIVRAS